MDPRDYPTPLDPQDYSAPINPNIQYLSNGLNQSNMPNLSNGLNGQASDQLGAQILLPCPNCGEYFQTFEKEIVCCIFRHAAYKSGLEPINPHASEAECKYLLDNDLVFGCTKPFRIIFDGEYKAVTCDYI